MTGHRPYAIDPQLRALTAGPIVDLALVSRRRDP